MEKQGKKRPAAGGEDKVGKNAKPRPDEGEVEEFFALIRRIRATSKLVDKEKSSRSPIFQWEDFVASSLNAGAGNAAAGDAAVAGGRGKELSPGRSSEDDDGKDGDDEEVEGAKGEGVEDNGLPGWLDLNVDLAAAKSPC